MNTLARTSKLAISKVEDIGFTEAGVATTPLLGLMRQKPLVSNPMTEGKSVRTWKGLQKILKPGDVLLSTDKGFRNFFKIVQAPVTGTPYFHAEVYTGRGRKAGVDFGTSKLPRGWEGSSVVAIRKRKRLTPKQTKSVVRRAKQIAGGPETPYGFGSAIRSWAKEVFVPKTPVTKAPAVPKCVAPICSTVPSRAYHGTMGTMVAGKKPGDVLPSDFLRDKSFKVVGRKMRGTIGRTGLERMLGSRTVRWGTRAGLGVAMGAGVFGLKKLLGGRSS